MKRGGDSSFWFDYTLLEKWYNNTTYEIKIYYGFGLD